MDVYGVGIDIEHIKRFKSMVKNKKSKIFSNIYSTEEILYCFSKGTPAQHLAVRFAAKEAVFKALSGLGKGLLYKDIEINNNNDGVPMVKLNDKKLKGIYIKISLSHTNDLATAVAIAFK